MAPAESALGSAWGLGCPPVTTSPLHHASPQCTCQAVQLSPLTTRRQSCIGKKPFNLPSAPQVFSQRTELCIKCTFQAQKPYYYMIYLNCKHGDIMSFSHHLMVLWEIGWVCLPLCAGKAHLGFGLVSVIENSLSPETPWTAVGAGAPAPLNC